MKFILKNHNNEPNTLKEYRSTPNASYSGFADTQQLLKIALCKEQGYLCCYCLRRIAPNRASVEHYITQMPHQNSPYSESVHKNHELDFMNMLGSCNDKNRNCSGIRGNEPLSIDPCNPQIDFQIGFRANGVAYAISENKAVQKDLEILKLGTQNNPSKDNMTYWLIENRKVIFDKVRRHLDKNGWTKSTCEKEIKKWQTPNADGHLEEHCQVAIFYLKKKMKALA